ncbi:hypothetical protein Scel_88180 [Streptomyces cellostaticus]|nr:hypothetical protein Scel_88180 [Streptomyces cellostaticus]
MLSWGNLTGVVEWVVLEPLLPKSNNRCGRWPDHRQVIDAIVDLRLALNGLGRPVPAGTVWTAVRELEEVRPMKAVSVWVLPLFVAVGD